MLPPEGGTKNLLLHGLEAPEIDPENNLRFKITGIGDKDRVDVILTNPPFSGEEELSCGRFPWYNYLDGSSFTSSDNGQRLSRPL